MKRRSRSRDGDVEAVNPLRSPSLSVHGQPPVCRAVSQHARGVTPILFLSSVPSHANHSTSDHLADQKCSCLSTVGTSAHQPLAEGISPSNFCADVRCERGEEEDHGGRDPYQPTRRWTQQDAHASCNQRRPLQPTKQEERKDKTFIKRSRKAQKHPTYKKTDHQKENEAGVEIGEDNRIPLPPSTHPYTRSNKGLSVFEKERSASCPDFALHHPPGNLQDTHLPGRGICDGTY